MPIIQFGHQTIQKHNRYGREIYIFWIELRKMKTIKKKTLNFLKFLCMILVLGIQELLNGSWTSETANQKTA